MASVGKSGKVYGLIVPKSKSTKPTTLVQKKASVFDDDSDDDNTNEKESVGPVGAVLLQKKKYEARIKMQTQLEIDRALAQDPTCYDYDSVYDEMQQDKKKNDVKVAAKADKKPKYIGGLLKAAEKRKREYERRVEREVQKERENEGDEFTDKESFVTTAYKKKMEEVQEEEEKAKREEYREALLDVTKQKDMSGFYRYLYKETTAMPAAAQSEERVEKSEESRSKKLRSSSSDSRSSEEGTHERSSFKRSRSKSSESKSFRGEKRHEPKKRSRSPKYEVNRHKNKHQLRSRESRSGSREYGSRKQRNERHRSRSNEYRSMKEEKAQRYKRSVSRSRSPDNRRRSRSPVQDGGSKNRSRLPVHDIKGRERMRSNPESPREISPEKNSSMKPGHNSNQYSSSTRKMDETTNDSVDVENEKFARKVSDSAVAEARAKYMVRKQAGHSVAAVISKGD